MRRILFLVAVVSLISGCNIGQLQQNIRNNVEQQCQSYGFQRGTDAFAQCIQRELHPNN